VVGLVGTLAAEGAEAAQASANWFVHHAWIIPLVPFASGALTLFFGKRIPGKGAAFGIAAVFVAFVMAIGVLWSFAQGGGDVEQNIEWFTIGSLHLQLGVFVDGLTAVMLVVVTSVSLCVHVYSIGYMHGDQRFTWFYVVLSLFTAAMLNVVIANDLFQLLVGWEIMGVCSYLLIGHWWEEHVNSSSAIKARSYRLSTLSIAIRAIRPLATAPRTNASSGRFRPSPTCWQPCGSRTTRSGPGTRTQTMPSGSRCWR